MQVFLHKSFPICCLFVAFLCFVLIYILWPLADFSNSSTLYGRAISFEHGQNIFNKYGSSAFSDQNETNISNTDVSTRQNSKKVLIVPGHDNEFYGAEFLNIKEADLTVELSDSMKENLDGFEFVFIRNQEGYNPQFLEFLENNQKYILAYQNEIKKNKNFISKNFEPINEIHNNIASIETAFKLYGINLFAEYIKADLVLHIHFNDYRRSNRNMAGKYSGFSLYVPHLDFSNGSDSNRFAVYLKEELKNFLSPSNLKAEKEIVIQDTDLIAIGPHNSMEIPAILIEYGYIYEEKFVDKNLRKNTFTQITDATYKALLKFFSNSSLATS